MWPFSSDETHSTASGLKIVDKRADRPAFERYYTADLGIRGLSIKVQIKNFIRLFKSAEILQSNGNWISFNADNPAEKIIDAEVLVATRKRLSEIMAIDDAFRRSPPSSFTDEDGVVWTRR